MDYTAGKFWLDVAQLAGTIVIGGYLWVVGRTRYNAQQHREHERAVDARLDNVELAQATTTERLRHLPDPAAQSAAVSRAHQRIDDLSDKTARIEGEMNGIESSLSRVNDHLLSR